MLCMGSFVIPLMYVLIYRVHCLRVETDSVVLANPLFAFVIFNSILSVAANCNRILIIEKITKDLFY